MCGIFGFSGVRANSNKLKILALYNESRGGHATGFYSDKFGIIKDTMSAEEFIAYYSSEMVANNLFFGHTRFKTHGDNTMQNAHPFIFNQIIGIHNGVIDNYKKIANEYNYMPKVDSECIFLSIANNINNEETILPDIIGEMAIAYTKGDGLLYLYRRENPIFIGYSKNGIYFSSLKESLFAIDCAKISLLAEHKIYVFNNGKLIKIIEVNEPLVTSMYSWSDYTDEVYEVYPSGFLFYDENELLAAGVSLAEIDYLKELTEEEQEMYLMEKGYI